MKSDEGPTYFSSPYSSLQGHSKELESAREHNLKKKYNKLGLKGPL